MQFICNSQDYIIICIITYYSFLNLSTETNLQNNAMIFTRYFRKPAPTKSFKMNCLMNVQEVTAYMTMTSLHICAMS